jgi:hypothetical protein
MTRFRHVAALAFALAALSCSGPTGDDLSGPGTVVVRFVSPNATPDAAIRFTLRGAPIGDVEPSDTHLVFSNTVSGIVHYFAVFGELTNGTEIRLEVPDRGALGDYEITLVEIADPSNALRPSLAGYAVVIER